MSFLLASSGLQRIIDGDGIAIAVTGMLVVFASLILISGAIALLPRLLHRYLPELEAHGAALASTAPAAAAPDALDERVVAAIGFALHSRKSS